MLLNDDHFELRRAGGEDELRAALRLRYRVFVEELGAGGEMVDHEAGLERDRFDAFADHLMLLDRRRPEDDRVVAVTRVMRADQAEAAGQFYTEGEYDLAPLKASGRRLLELGRTCLHPDFRGGTAMWHLWQGIADYVAAHRIEVMFGTASFPGTDPEPLAAPLAFLHHRHLAPPELRPRARAEGFLAMDRLPEDGLDRAAASRALPALIKAYLRLGGMVGEGAWVDEPFNCTDVCLVLDTARMSAKHRAIYDRGGA